MPFLRLTRVCAAGVLATLGACALASEPAAAGSAAPPARAVAAASGSAAAPRAAALADRVVIRRTAHGVPHIEASGPYGLGLGYGYAFARDNICAIADDFATVNAERSRWFGPDGISDRPAAASTNVASDLFWRQMIDSGTVERLVARRPPGGQREKAGRSVRRDGAGYIR